MKKERGVLGRYEKPDLRVAVLVLLYLSDSKRSRSESG